MNEFWNTWDMKRVYKWGTIVLMALALFLALEALSVIKNLRHNNPPTNVISVSGTGEATSVPDIATFSFTVSEDAKNVADAQKSVTAKTDTITAALKELGIEEKDIKTTDYNVNPKYVYQQASCVNGYCGPGRQIADGYTVSNTISVKVRNTENSGKALSIAGEKGAMNVSGLSLTLDDPSEPENEARLKAIDNAREKAEVLADRLGVDLVRIVSYYENSSPYPMPMYAGYDKAMNGAATSQASAPSVSLGQNTVTSNVTVSYEIR